jgi:hypothetical protein
MGPFSINQRSLVSFKFRISLVQKTIVIIKTINQFIEEANLTAPYKKWMVVHESAATSDLLINMKRKFTTYLTDCSCEIHEKKEHYDHMHVTMYLLFHRHETSLLLLQFFWRLIEFMTK